MSKQRETTRSPCWLILDMNTGAVDGWYLAEELARGVLANFKRDYPSGRWVLLRAETEMAPIPDHMFWVERLRKSA